MEQQNMIELGGNQSFFGVGLGLRPEVREFNPGGGGLEADFAYRVEVVKIEGDQKQGKPPQFVFRTIVREPGFEGIERSVYVDIPQPINPQLDAKTRKALEIDHDVMLTTLRSLGVNEAQIRQFAAQGNMPYGTIFSNLPGRGVGFVFARTWERKKMDKATNQAVRNAVTGEAETEEKIVLDFCTPEHYAKHSASGKAQREAQAKNAGGAPSFQPNAPAFTAPAPSYAPAPAPAYAAPAPAATPSWNAPAPAAPQGWAPQGAAPMPNGQYGAPAPAPGGIMGVMQTPRA